MSAAYSPTCRWPSSQTTGRTGSSTSGRRGHPASCCLPRLRLAASLLVQEPLCLRESFCLCKRATTMMPTQLVVHSQLQNTTKHPTAQSDCLRHQAECLLQPDVLTKCSNLVYCAPTSGGKSLVAEVRIPSNLPSGLHSFPKPEDSLALWHSVSDQPACLGAHILVSGSLTASRSTASASRPVF